MKGEKVEKEDFNRLSETPLWQNELVPLFLEIQGSIEQIIQADTIQPSAKSVSYTHLTLPTSIQV